MADSQTGQDQTVNDQTEEQTSQNEQQEKQVFKVYESEDQWKSDMDSRFKTAYNQHREKVIKDFKSMGLDVDDYDSAISTLSGMVSSKNDTKKDESSDSVNGEVKALRERLDALQKEKEDYLNQLETTKMDNFVSKQSTDAFSKLSSEGELKLDRKALETLFFAEHDLNADDKGNYYVVNKDGVPDLNENNERRSVSESLQSFVKRNNYITPKKQGAGGATGGTVAGDRPKRSEFQKLIRSRNPDDVQRAEQLYAKMKEAGGWAQE